MNELIRMEDLNVIANVQQGSIKFNYDETKAQLEAVLAEYQGAVFSDESIKSAKVLVAELRAKQKEFDKRRKDVKAEYNKTFVEFEEKAKELNAMFDKPINFIVDQIDGFDERRKAEKKAKIEELYKNVIDKYESYLPLSKIYNPKWENATFRIGEIEKEIVDLIYSTASSIKTIESMNSESVEKALVLFKNDLSLANAIAYINNYEKQKAEILEKEKEKNRQEEERKAQEIIENAKREEREKIIAEQKATQDIENAKLQAERDILAIKEFDEKSFFADGSRKAFSLEVYATEEEIEQVKIYLNSIGVEYSERKE